MKIIAALLIVAVLLAAVLGYESASELRAKPKALQYADSAFAVQTRLPAVDKEGNGLVAELSVEAKPGLGRVFIRSDAANPLVLQDTQSSVRTAVDVAKSIAGVDAASIDVFYSMTSDAESVAGGSAGAAISVATIAALRHEQLRSDVMVTGTVNAAGSIGAVGGVLAKARAAKGAGAATLLVPKGERMQTLPKEDCVRRVLGGQVVTKCTTTYEEVDVAVQAGINVTEVGDVAEAHALMVQAGET